MVFISRYKFVTIFKHALCQNLTVLLCKSMIQSLKKKTVLLNLAGWTLLSRAGHFHLREGFFFLNGQVTIILTLRADTLPTPILY